MKHIDVKSLKDVSGLFSVCFHFVKKKTLFLLFDLLTVSHPVYPSPALFSLSCCICLSQTQNIKEPKKDKVE